VTVPAGASFWVPRQDGVDLRLRLQPGASKDGIGEIVTLADGRQVLAASVRAVPEKGRANKALCRMVAKALGVAAGRVSVASGQKDRVKTLHIEGETADLVAGARALGRIGGT
jgi:hypothetical protein